MVSVWKCCVFNPSITTKKRYFSFLKYVFVLEKIGFNVKVLRTFKTSCDFHIKACRSLKQKAILKSLEPACRRAYALSVGFNVKPLTKSAFLSNFAVRLVEMLKEETTHFCLFGESHFSNICTL